MWSSVLPPSCLNWRCEQCFFAPILDQPDQWILALSSSQRKKPENDPRPTMWNEHTIVRTKQMDHVLSKSVSIGCELNAGLVGNSMGIHMYTQLISYNPMQPILVIMLLINHLHSDWNHNYICWSYSNLLFFFVSRLIWSFKCKYILIGGGRNHR